MGRPNRRHRGKPAGSNQRKAASIGQAERPRSPRDVAVWGLLFAVALGGLIWNHHALFFLSWTDEQIHLYVARRLAQGAVLYRDVDSARPPLALFPIAGLIKAGCPPLLAGRALVLIVQVGTAGLLFWGGWRLVSWRAGALSALLALTSPETFARVAYSGIHLPALTAAAAVLFFLREQPFRAGLLVGLTAAVDQHGLAVAGVVAVLTIVRRPRDTYRFALGVVAVIVPVFGGAMALGGRHLWRDLVGLHLYHLSAAQGANAQLWESLGPWLYEHVYLLAGVALAAGFLGRTRPKEEDSTSVSASPTVVRVLFLVVGVHVAVVLAMSDAPFLYLIVVVPLLTLLSGIGFDAAIGWWQSRRTLPPVKARGRSTAVVAGTAALVALTFGGWAAARKSRERLDNRAYSFWPYVRNAEVFLSQRMDVAEGVARDPIMPTTGTIFGEPMIVSAVALDSGARVSGELADLNPNWIEAGAVSRDEVISRVEHDGVAAVITPPWFFIQDHDFRSYIVACYGPPKVFKFPPAGPGAGLPDILVFRRTGAPFPCQAASP